MSLRSQLEELLPELLPSDPAQAIRLPGHEFPQMKAQNKEKGIPVDERVWQTIRAL